MPKVTRQSHQGYYRSTPLAQNNQAINTNNHRRNTSCSSTNNQLLAQQQANADSNADSNADEMPQLPIQQHSHSLAQSYYPTHTTTMQSQPSYHRQTQQAYTQGGPVQHPQNMSSQQYTHIQTTSQTQSAPTHSLRPSSGAWNPQDDQTLMAARASGMNWAPIQAAYFPTKTPNACRKRHERLMERRNASDWDGLKLENLAKNYMSMRREIWSGLAAQTGEKWAVVEAKCMASGLKNLQAAARSGSRRERLGVNGGVTGVAYTDDSGIGLDLGDGEELDEMEGGVGEGDEYADSEGSGHGYGGGHAGMQQYVSGRHHGSRRSQYQQRLPSMDMGIGAIINRNN